jgi:hypothetical protein
MMGVCSQCARRYGNGELLALVREINGWAIDAANGANRPVIIMATEAYYRMLQITDVGDIANKAAQT